MTAWPLNCAAANAAEMVLWRRGSALRHPLLIDTPAVPLRFDIEAPVLAAEVAAPASTPKRSDQAAQVYRVR
jgi:hypothetical protein